MRATEFYKTILDHINRNHSNPDITFYSGALLNDLGQRRPRSLFCHRTQTTLDELHTLLGIDPEKWNAAYDKMVSGEWQQLSTYPGPSGDTPEAYASKAVWLMTLPHISVVDGTQIAHYESVDKLNREVETRIRYGRYLTNVMKISDPQTHVESLQAQLGQLPVSFVENDDADGWLEVYSSGSISSCMKGVDAVKCYAAAAFGLPDNGLRLAYLGAKSNAKARCIVNERTKEYVRNYGDSALVSALENLGYEENQTCLDGAHLATWRVDGTYWAAPYVDDHYHREADLEYIDGNPCLRLSCGGSWELDNTCGYVGDEPECCRECGNGFHNDDLYTVYYVSFRGELEARDERVCDGCLSENYIRALYEGDRYWVANDDVIEIDGEYYANSASNLEYYDFVYSHHAEEYLHESDVVWSEFHGDWLPPNDAVFSEVMDDYLLKSESAQIGDDYVPEMCVIFDEDAGLWIQNPKHPYLSAEQLAELQGTSPKSEGVPTIPVWQDIEDVRQLSTASVVRLKPEFWELEPSSGYWDQGNVESKALRAYEGHRVGISHIDVGGNSVRTLPNLTWLNICRLQVRGGTQLPVSGTVQFRARDLIRVKSNARQVCFDAGQPGPGWNDLMDEIQGLEFEVHRLSSEGWPVICTRGGREWYLLPEWVEPALPAVVYLKAPDVQPIGTLRNVSRVPEFFGLPLEVVRRASTGNILVRKPGGFQQWMRPDWLQSEPVFRPGITVKLRPGTEDEVRGYAAPWSDEVGRVCASDGDSSLVKFPDAYGTFYYRNEWLQPVQQPPQDENLAA